MPDPGGRRVAEVTRAADLPVSEARARYTLVWALRAMLRTRQARAEADRVIALRRRTGQVALLAPALTALALTGVHHGSDEEIAASLMTRACPGPSGTVMVRAATVQILITSPSYVM
ncbi:hypothetical protein AB0I68_26595 [Streptomyces sp. NPDC050448]|uniref:hypothetical protein n=1 Tax=Streptomyces sp. NPDC050448 TaxID=3155404 RepID=UPI003446DD28